MFVRTFRQLFERKKNRPIVNAKKAPKARKQPRLGLELLEDRVVPANFTAGDLAVIDLAASSSNTTGSILELHPTGSGQSPVQTIGINGTSTPNEMRFSNSGTSSFLSRSNDGSLLVFGGYNTTDSSTADLANTTTSDRAVGTLNSSASFNLATTYTGINGNQDRSATTTDDSHFYITDKGGLYSNGETAPTFATNILSTKSFGGTVYVSSTKTAIPVNTVSSPTSTSVTPLPGLTADTSIQDFYLIQSGNNGSTYDILYTLSGSNIKKFSLVSGSWTANGSYAAPVAGLSLAAAKSGSGASLYYTTGTTVIAATDTAGYNATINVITANNQTLYTVSGATGDAFVKGIDFVPQGALTSTTTTLTAAPASPEPAGTSVTFTATISPTAPSGETVTFMDGSNTLGTGTTNSSGVATYSTSSLTVATHSITAVYAGDSTFAGSTSNSLSYQITGATSTTTVSASPNPGTAGGTETLTATVTATQGTPTGTVQFMDGSTAIGSPAAVNSGTATLTISTLTAGVHSITGVYSGNSSIGGSTSSSYSLTINQAPVFTSGTNTLFGVGAAGSFNVTATGFPTPTYAETGALPSGVALSSAGVLSGTPAAGTSGVYPITITATNSAGSSNQSFILTVAFTDWVFTAAASAPDNSPAPTTGTGTATTLGMTNSYNAGSVAADDVLNTAGTANSSFSENTLRVRGAQIGGSGPSGNGWATHAAGAAQYTQGLELDASTVGMTNIGFQFDWYSTTQGIRDLQVQYNTNINNANGWTNFGGASPTGTYIATANDYYNAPNSPTITINLSSITAANNDPNFGIRLVSAYDSTGNVPNDYASAALGTGGQTVIYNNSSGNWRFDNMAFFAGAISQAGTSSVLTVTPASPQNPGTNVTFTDTITPSSGTANPTGTVQFYANGQALGSPVNVTAGSGITGVATLSTGALTTLGTQLITAVYSPTGTFAGSTSNQLSYVIGDPTISSVSANPTSPQQTGTSITFTDVITPANIGGTSSPDGNPTGTVQFKDNGALLGSPVTVTAGAGSTGTASFTTSALTSGTHNITAIYTPTGDYLASTSSALGYAVYNPGSGPFTPGNLVILQAGDGVNNYNAQAPLYLNEITNTGQNVQQVAIPAVGAAAITSATESGGTVTVTTASAPGLTNSNGFVNGETIAIAGLSQYNGTFPINVTGANTFTYTVTDNGAVTVNAGATATPGQVGNQPITIDLSAAAGNGQLNRSYDGSSLTFDGIDSTVNNGGLTGSATPTGSSNRVVAEVTGDATVTSDINTTVYGPFYVGDDNRGSIADGPTGPLYTAGHPNQAGGAVSQGVHEFDSTNGAAVGAEIGTQVSASTNIRGVTIGFDNRMYFSTAGGLGGSSALNAAGIFTEPTALPTSSTPTPANDIMVVPALFGASKLGGVFLADMNGDGIIDNGDRLYFLDDGTVGGSGTGGLYVSTWNSTNDYNPWNTGNAFGVTGASWAAGTATIAANNDFTAGESVSISGIGGATGFNGTYTIVSANATSFTYALATDPTSGGTLTPTFSGATAIVNNNAAAAAAGFVDHWGTPVRLGDAPVQAGSGNVGQLRGLTGTVVGAGIASASESGTTVTITLAGSNSFQAGQSVQISGVGAGYDGSWTIASVNGNTVTYTALSSGLSTATPSNGLASQAVLYTSAFDDAANDSSVIQQWVDTNTGVSIASAAESGTTVTITTTTPNTFQTGQVVEVDGVGANSGAAAITTGYNGAWTITVIDSTHFSYHDTNAGASNLATFVHQGAADDAIQTDQSQDAAYSNFGIGNGRDNNNSFTVQTLGGTIIQVLAGGVDTVGNKSFAEVGLRGISFAPVAATTVSLAQSPANPLTPGTTVTLTATLTNSQVTPTGLVTFIDANTNTILGQAPIVTTGGVTTATFTTNSLVGYHYVQAYFGGGGTLALASARSNTIQVQEAGATTSTTSVTATPAAAAIAKQVTLTATVTTGATGTVSFFNGSVSLANLLGTAPVVNGTATLTTAFTSAGSPSIIAFYNGDGTYNVSQGATTVNVAANASATITTSANNVALNATPTYTAAIVGNSTLGVPAGTVIFTIVSATTGTNGAPLVSQTSAAMTLTPGSGNTATATWTSPALSAPGSYFVTISYSATGASNPYSNFAVTTTNASNGVALIETVQKAFTPGNLVAVQRGDGTVNLGSSAYPVVLVEYSRSGGAEVQAIVLPDASSGSTNALFLSGQNGSEGLINRSANGAFLTLSGYDLPAGHTFVTSTFPFQFPRTIAEVNAAGGIDTSTAISTTQVGITAISETGTTVTATATTTTGLSVGQSVVITGVTPSGYNGQFTITGINAGANTFTYTAASNLGSATVSSAFATASSVPYNPLDVVSFDGQEFWLASNLPVGDTTDNGIEYVGSVGATSATQIGAGNNSAAALSIAGGQLYVTTGKNVQAVGTGLPTTSGQSLTALPNLANAYQAFFPNKENPEQVLLLNTNDGTTNNPNVAYVADQANGLLKFYLNTAGVSSLTESGTTVTVTLSAAPATPFTTGDQVQIAGASVSGYNGTYAITVVDGTHFTYTTTASGLASATGGTASEWLYGKNGTGVFGQKLVFAGGATGLTGYVVNPGASAQVQLYITGSNVTQANPNQIDSLLDANSPSQGFPSGNFSNLGFVGGASSGGSPNGNENFAGLAFVPGAVTTTTVTSSGATTFGNNVTFTATVTSPVDTPAGTVSFYNGTTLLGTSALNASGVATFTTTSPLAVGENAISAVYNPGGQSLANDDVSTGKLTQEIDYKGGDLIVTQVGFSSNIASVSVNGTTVTVAATNALPFQLNQTGLFLTLAGNNGTNVNGTYPITLTGPNSFTYTASGAVAGTGGTVSVGASTTVTSVAVSGTTATATVSSVSNIVSGQQATIAGNAGSGVNGVFTVLTVNSSAKTFTYTVASGSTGGSGGTAASAVALSSSTTTATYLTDYTVNPGTGATTLNTGNIVNLPTAAVAATISGAAWSVSNDTATFTTSAAHNMQAGQLVTIAGVAPSGYNGTYTILSVPTTTTFVVGLLADPGTYASGGTAQVDQNALTEGGTTTTAGYVTTSVDGHSVEIGGNAGGSSDVGVLNPDGTFNDSTILPSALGGVRAVASPDGSGFWLATGTGIRFVTIGGDTPSSVGGASWANTNGGTATITAPNTYVAGQTVVVAGITGATGYNGTFTILSASANSFTYALATQPSGTPTFTGATSQLLPTLISNEADNLGNGQFPSAVTIGTDLNGNANQLLADAGNQFQNNGVNSIDGPFEVGSNLPTTGGQPITIYGNGTGTNFPNATDRFGNFPTSAQFAVSPDGNTVFVADSRTDGLGGVLEYFQVTPNKWRLIGNVQLDSFRVTGATETGNVVTVATSGATDFYVGESVSISGVSLAAYDGNGFTVTGVSGSTFTYTANFTGLAASGVNTTGAFATSADGGVRGLAADFTDNGANDGGVILYVTTSQTSGNRLLEITGGNVNGNPGSLAELNNTALATAAPGTAFRGVAFAPARPGTTASTTSISASGYNLTATVTSGATGWVEFFQVVNSQNVYIGTSFINGTTATLNVEGLLPAGTYTVLARYTGSSTYAASTSPTTSATIAAIGTSTTLTFSPSTVGTNQSDVLTATINVPSGQSPTGLVTFTNTTNSTVLGYGTVSQVIQNINFQPVVTFVATLTVPAGTFSAGTYNISAAYNGDAYFGGSTGTGSLSVVNSTTTTVTSPGAGTPGQNLTLTAAVTSTAGTPGGTVQFYDDQLALGSAVTVNGSGVATLTVPTALVQSVSVLSASSSTTGGVTTVTLTTDANNPAFVGEQIVVEGIGTTAYDSSPGQTFPNLAQAFTVTAVSGNTLSYVDAAANGAPTDAKGGLAVGLNVLTPGVHSISAVYTPTGSSLSSFAGSTGVHEQVVTPQAFGASDVFVERNGDGVSPLNTRAPNPNSGSIGTTVYIDEKTPSGTLVQSYILPSADSQVFSVSNATWASGVATIATATASDIAVGQVVTVAGIGGATGYNGDFTVTGVSGNTFTYVLATQPTGTPTFTGATAQGAVHAVVGDGSQSTTGQISLSGDGQSLFLTGYDNNPLPYGTALPLPSASAASGVPRSLARISAGGVLTTEAFSTGVNGIDSTSGNSGVINGVYSPDGNQFYLSSFNGIYYFPSLTQSANLQGSLQANQIDSTSYTVNGLEAFGGNLYAIGTGSTAGTANRVQQVGVGLPTTTQFNAITAASWASQVATITVSGTNTFAVGQSVLIDNVGGATGYNGVFTITAVSGQTISYALTTQPTGTPVFTGAYAVLQTPLTQLPGIPVNSTSEPIPVFFGVDAYFTHLNGAGTNLDTIYLADDGKSFGGGDITKWSLTSVNVSNITVSGTTATVTLANGNLGLTTGENVNLTLAGNSGGSNASLFNGTVAVAVSSGSSTTFTFTVPSGTTAPTTFGTASGFVEAPTAILYSQSTPQLGFYWLAGQTNSSTGAVTLYSTYGNGGNADFGPGILYSVSDTNGFGKAPGTPITAVSWSGGTVTVTAANNFVAGNFVDVEGMAPTGYNGQFTILSASPTQFTYALSSNPGTATTLGYANSVNVVNSVAFEGAGGGFIGNETYRGVALAPQNNTVSTTTTVTSTPASPITQGTSITFTGTVSGNPSVGTETFYAGPGLTNQIGSPVNVVNGSATSAATTALPVGTDTITAVYSGGTGFSGSQGTEQVVVNQIGTTTTINSFSPNPGVAGSPVTFSITVTAGSGNVPNGETVQLEDADNGNAVLASGTTSGGNGAVSIPYTWASPGTHHVIAAYVGDTNFAGSASGQTTVTVVSSSVPTITTLFDNGPNPSQSGLGVVFSGSVVPNSGPAISGETVSIEDASNSNAVVATATITNDNFSTTISNLSVGAHNLFAVYAGDSVNQGSSSIQLTHTVAAGFQVNSWSFTPNGVLINFDAPVNEGTTHLYDASGGSLGAADVTLVGGSTGAVRGSLVVDPTTGYQVRLLKTAGLLASDNYTLTVTTGVQAVGGATLSGNYTNTQTLTAATTPTLSIPSFARGPSQAVNVPASGTAGIPITISGAATVTAAHFTLTYDPTILTIAATGAVTLSSGATAGGLTATYTITPLDSRHSMLTVNVTGGSWNAGSSPTTLLNIAATVPNGSQYLDKAVLSMGGVTVNGSAGQGVSGIDEDAYVGDVKGAKSYTPLDAATDSQVSAGSGTGFATFRDLDPVIIGDTSGQGNGQVIALDPAQISQAASGATVSTIPAIPGGATQGTGGADPVLYFQAASAGAGQSTVVHLMLNVTDPNGITLAALGEAIGFDQTFFTVSNVVGGGGSASISSISESGTTVTVTTSSAVTDLAVGSSAFISGVSVSGYNGVFAVTSVNGNTFTYTAASSGLGTASVSGATAGTGLLGLGQYTTTPGTVDNTNGLIRISQFYSGSGNYPTLPTGALLDVVDFTATVSSGAAAGATTPLNLLATGSSNGSTTSTAVYDANGPLTLNPAPTNASNDAGVDSTLTVVGENGKLYFNAASASAGSTITVPLEFTNGAVPFQLAALGEAISFDPTKLQVTGVTTGSGLSGLGQYTTTPGTIDNTNGLIRISQFFSGSGNYPTIAAGQTIDVVDITFTVSGSASGSTVVNLDATGTSNGSTTTTAVYDPNQAIALNPAPTNAATDAGIDGMVSIVVQPNQPPFDRLPSATTVASALGGVGVLFNPAVAMGLQTATANKVVFSSANGDAITVTDSDYKSSGPAETTTVSIIGSPTGTSTGPVGMLSATASGAATVSGNGTTTLTITGSPSDITATLNGLTYQPGAGFFGTTTLTISTNDNGNSGFGGPLTDTHSTSITVVGLFISEIQLTRVTTGNPANSGQYLEVFSTAPNYTIPTGVYVVGVNGDKLSTGPAPGVVQDIFNLGTLTTGTQGYLAFLEKPTSGTNPYLNSGDVTGDAVFVNSGTSVGFGNGGTTSKFNGVNGVHTGATRTGRTGENATDLELGSVSYLLIETSTAPNTASNIDPAATGTPNGSTYAGWNVLDGVGILRNTNGTGGPDRSYAPITFKSTSNTTGTTISGSTVVPTSTWTATYVGRIAKNTGESSVDWLASVPTGSNGAYTLSATQSTAFGGQALNNIGSPNYWAPEETVVVNDGSSNQHSQVTELTITFNEPVSIANLQGDFVVKDAQGDVITTTVTVVAGTDNGDGTASGVTQLVITFNNDTSADTFAFAGPDPFGNTRGLNDGNYFLNSVAADITNNGVALDGAHNGVGGSTTTGSGNLNGNGANEVDEFWRLFGDTLGRRRVDNTDLRTFVQAYNSSSTDSNYLWYLDSNEDGTINNTDKTAISNELFKKLNA